MDSCDIKRQYFLDGEVKERTMLNKVRKEENFKKYSYNKLTLSFSKSGLHKSFFCATVIPTFTHSAKAKKGKSRLFAPSQRACKSWKQARAVAEARPGAEKLNG